MGGVFVELALVCFIGFHQVKISISMYRLLLCTPCSFIHSYFLSTFYVLSTGMILPVEALRKVVIFELCPRSLRDY